MQRVLDTITDAAAFVRNGRLDILSANRLGDALYADAFANPERPTNLARFVFLDPRSQTFYGDWDGIADATVGSLRAEAGRDPYDRELTDLVGELSMHSDHFRIRWGTHDVRLYAAGTQRFHHTLVGDLTLRYETFEPVADIGLTMIVYAADPAPRPTTPSSASPPGASTRHRPKPGPPEGQPSTMVTANNHRDD